MSPWKTLPVGLAVVAACVATSSAGAAKATGNGALQYGVSLYSYTGEYGVTMTLDDCVEDVADHDTGALVDEHPGFGCSLTARAT